MRVSYHPEFPKDITKFAGQYREISPQLAARFRREVDKALEQIKGAPSSAGHFVNTGSQIVKEIRCRNLSSLVNAISCALAFRYLAARAAGGDGTLLREQTAPLRL